VLLYRVCSFFITLQRVATYCNIPLDDTDMQRVATYCNNPLQHAARWWGCYTGSAASSSHCNTLQHTATHCNTLQHTARWWCYCTGSAAALSLPLRSSTQRAFRVSSSTLPPTSSLILAPRSFSLHRSVLQRGAVYCSVLQCVAVCCSVLQCPTYIIPDSNHKIILNLRVCVATRCLSASPSGTAWYLCREQ